MPRSFGEKVAEEALSWKGTPFVWGQSQKGVGCDCKGFIAGVARELGRPEAENFYATFSGYRSDRPVPSDLLMEGMEKTFKRVDEIKPGDVLLLKHNGRPGHLAIATFNGRAVHTQISSRAWVKETQLGALYHFYPLHSIWRWRRK
jgi:cell wall-associated NlpC family hydrolase